MVHVREHPGAGRSSTSAAARAFVVGGILVVGASVLAYLLFTTEFLGRFTPSGRATTAQLMTGALAWTFALTAPAGFGLLGLLRVGSAVERVVMRRRRPTPVLRIAHAVADDHAVATRVRLPDGARVLPELVGGPFERPSSSCCRWRRVPAAPEPGGPPRRRARPDDRSPARARNRDAEQSGPGSPTTIGSACRLRRGRGTDRRCESAAVRLHHAGPGPWLALLRRSARSTSTVATASSDGPRGLEPWPTRHRIDPSPLRRETAW
jgi:hypothetical protein